MFKSKIKDIDIVKSPFPSELIEDGMKRAFANSEVISEEEDLHSKSRIIYSNRKPKRISLNLVGIDAEIEEIKTPLKFVFNLQNCTMIKIWKLTITIWKKSDPVHKGIHFFWERTFNKEILGKSKVICDCCGWPMWFGGRWRIVLEIQVPPGKMAFERIVCRRCYKDPTRRDMLEYKIRKERNLEGVTG